MTTLLEGDHDLAAYRTALATAEAERKRVERAIATYGSARTTPDMLKRYLDLTTAITGLRELAKAPPTH